MELEALADAGLSSAESKVYLSLLELGQTRSGPIVDRAGLQPSVVFLTLHSLVDKGLVTTIKSGKHKRYTASSPKVLQELLGKRQRRLEEAMPALLARREKAAPEGAEVFEGISGLQAMFFSMIEDAKKGEEFLYFDAEEHEHQERAKLVYLPFQARCREKGVIVKGIQQTTSKTKDVYAKNVRLAFTAESIPPDTSIFRDKLALVTWSDTPKAVLITSQPLADQYRRLWQGFAQRAQAKRKKGAPTRSRPVESSAS